MSGTAFTRERLMRGWPIAVLFAEAMAFFRQVLFSNSFIPWDLPGYHLPLAAFLAGALREGRFPLWDPYTYCGFPYFANIQSQAYYPPMLISAWIANLIGPRKLANILEWQVALHVFLGGALAYLLARRLRLSRCAALFAGTVYLMGAYFATQAQHLGAICGAAWMPLAWHGAIELAERPSNRWIGLTAIPLAMSILCGFPSTFLVTWGTFLVLILILLALRHATLRTLIYAGLAMVLGLLIAAPVVLPTMELSSLAIAQARFQWQSENGVPWQGFVSLLIPDYFHVYDPGKYTLRWNFTFVYLYCGWAALGLAAAALIAGAHRYRWVLTALFLFSTLWMAGDYTPVYGEGKWLLPGVVRGSGYAEFALAAFVLCFALVSAVGFEKWVTPRPAWFAALVLALTCTDLLYHNANRPMNTGRPGDLRRISEEEFENSRVVPVKLHELAETQVPPLRFDVLDGSTTWPYNFPMLRLYSAIGNDPLALARFLNVRGLFASGPAWLRSNQVDHPGSRIMDLLNVGYVISYRDSKSPLLQSGDLEPVSRDLDIHAAWKNPNPLPRFFLVPRTRAANNGDRALGFMEESGFQPDKVAIVEKIRGRAYSPGAVRVLDYRPERVALEVEGSGPMFLVTTETWYPGWRALVDGTDHPIILTNVAFRGLEVPAGKHTVEFRFQPRIFWWALALGLSASLAAVYFTFSSRSTLPSRT